MAGADRPFAVVATLDQWLRSTHEGTAVDADTGAVQLATAAAGAPAATGPRADRPGALAFDDACRLYRSVPSAGVVERYRWRPDDPRGRVPAGTGSPLLGPAAAPVVGDFGADPTGSEAPPASPGPLAVDDLGRLHVADAATGTVTAYDLVDGRVVARVALAPHAVVDLVADGPDVLVLAVPAPGAAGPDPSPFVPAGGAVPAVAGGPPAGPGGAVLLRLAPGAQPVPVPLPAAAAAVPGDATPVAVARTAARETAVLFAAAAPGPASGWLAVDGTASPLPVDGGLLAAPADAVGDRDGGLVVGGAPGEPLLRWARRDGRWLADPGWLEGTGADGSRLVATPSGRVGYWTAAGLRLAFPARSRHRRDGRVVTYRLDGGAPRTAWGRVFLDACVPSGTSIGLLAATTDDPGSPDVPEPAVPWVPPAGADVTGIDPAAAPPMLPLALVRPAAEAARPYRRDTGPELAWVRRPAGDPFRTYEAPVMAPPGRFLWLTLVLRGSGRATPKVRAARIERPGHDLLRRLPAAWSEDEAAADFLRRFLGPVDGELQGLLARSAARHLLVDPRTTPSEALEWLAGFVGLVLDRRVPIDRRRRMVAEVATLFRSRGTVAGVARFVELTAGVPVTVIERWRLRGLGGAVLDETSADAASWPVLGAGFRVGGAVAGPGAAAPGEGPAPAPDAFATSAHRFSVLVPAALSPDGLGAVRHVLEVHRPAHTVVDVCTVDGGMQVGVGLHVGLSSAIGPTSGFGRLVLGDAVLGRDALLGAARTGVRPGSARTGSSTRVG
ncbi:MAG TPA: phage tail protein [Acidimicrobiales bacterium]